MLYVGKTTIIEALKYCTSGCLPPGARNGQSFVNDPAMTDSTDVKAFIKLSFKNRQGFKCLATRSLQLLRKKSKLEFKALDASLKTYDATGEESGAASNKCSELNIIVPDLIGVTSAVLENVIFCHQEESDWPLQDGATVKKKFDDIFDSTRYSKALEAAAKAKKDKQNIAKDLQGQVRELNAHLYTAKQLRHEKSQCDEQQTEIQQQIDDIDEKLLRLNERVSWSF